MPKVISSVQIRKRRKRSRRTQEDTATLAGMNLKTYQRWERGEIPDNPNPDWVEGLAGVFRCEVVDLMTVDFKMLYDTLMSDVDDLIHDDQPFMDKSAELRGWSKELRQWQIFFEQSRESAEELEKSDAQKALEDALMPEDSGDPAEGV